MATAALHCPRLLPLHFLAILVGCAVAEGIAPEVLPPSSSTASLAPDPQEDLFTPPGRRGADWRPLISFAQLTVQPAPGDPSPPRVAYVPWLEGDTLHQAATSFCDRAAQAGLVPASGTMDACAGSVQQELAWQAVRPALQVCPPPLSPVSTPHVTFNNDERVRIRACMLSAHDAGATLPIHPQL